MKIALCCPYFLYGGAEVQFLNLVHCLAASSQNIIYIYCLSKNPKIESIDKLSNYKNVSILFFNCDSFNSSKLKIIIRNVKISINILKFKPNIVYFYSLFLFPLVFLKVFGFKIFYSERILSERTNNFNYFYWILTKICDKFIVNSSTVYTFFYKKYYCKNLVLIRNLVKRVVWNQANNNNIALVSRISKEKNIDYVISSFKEKKYRINIYYSSFEKKYFEYINNILNESDNLITLFGYRNKNEIYTNNSILIHPSTAEGSPNVIIEAMLSRFPVLASNIPTIIETGIHKSCLFNPSISESLCNTYNYFKKISHSDLKDILDYNFKAAQKFNKTNFYKSIKPLFK